MSPRIAIDARMIDSSGIGTYLRNLLEELAGIENEFQFEVGCLRPDLISRLPSTKFRFVRKKARIYGVKEQWEILRLARRADLLHCPHYNVPYFYRGRLVVTIHDLSHLMFPKFLPSRPAYLYARVMLGAAVKMARKIITDSQFSKQAIQERFSVPDERIRVIYPGPSQWLIPGPNAVDPAPVRRMGVTLPYVLFVGLLKPHKNVGRLIGAFARLAAERRNGTQLVIAGKKGSDYPTLGQLARELAVDKQVIFTGHVSQDDLMALYTGAAVFALPSLNEGFGLPALEAMAYGVPVVASNCSSLPEVVGDAGLLVDPRDEGAIADALERLLADRALCQRLGKLGRERARQFSSRKAAQQHLEVYREVLSN
jgi:glycosyltransferase involved in cell wall biosynthesis